MHNPYATSSAGEGAPQATPFAAPGDTRTTDYNDAIGPNREHYRPRFEQYDARGAGISWHWPAFFATSAWFAYRKLYLIGILNFFYPWMLWFVAGLLISTRVVSPGAGGAAILLLSPLPWILLTITANRIYWRRVNRLIQDTPRGDPMQRSRALARAGGVARGPMAVMVILTVLFAVANIGVVAAIAIPAYQDYTIRAQVTEGLNLASPVKAQVAEHWRQHRRWLEQGDIPGEIPRGKYVESVAVESGSVVITYGGQANTKLTGLRLTLMPGVAEDGAIVWACGDAALPQGAQPGSGPHGSELPAKYMPARCRKGGTDQRTLP